VCSIAARVFEGFASKASASVRATAVWRFTCYHEAIELIDASGG
jgi:hypothetical protein